eukprot:1767960-Lingulodinium_polyedra.AAC.1
MAAVQPCRQRGCAALVAQLSKGPRGGLCLGRAFRALRLRRPCGAGGSWSAPRGRSWTSPKAATALQRL